jgi:hypothetical protein
VIDGRLDEEIWKNAVPTEDFWLSSEQRPPSEKTEVLVASDGQYLYFAFRCHDSRPEFIRTIKERRDTGMGYDDSVSVKLDPFLDRRSVSTYSVNANGIQDDDFAGGRARKIEWKGDWQASAARTEYGWSAEMAIPFSILNYTPETDEMGINFVRYHNRTDEWSYWADLTPRYLNEEMGRLTGLHDIENSRPQRWTFMPYVLTGANVPDIHGEVKDRLASTGADIRYTPKPNITGVLSLHPDFSQLEEQVTDIDFSYTEKYLADPRPFFQEGSSYLGNDSEYFYSNRLPDHYAGAKSFGQWRSGAAPQQRSMTYKAGGLITRAPDDRWDAALRLVRENGPRHATEMMLVATSRETMENQLLVAQVDGGKARGAYYDMDLAYSNTTNQEFEHGGKWRGGAGWREDYWSVGLAADYYDRDYFPANGLLPDDRNDTRSLFASADYYREHSKGIFRSVSGSMSLNRRDTNDGQTQNHNAYLWGSVEFRQQMAIDLEYFKGKYRPNIGERGEFASSINNDHYWGVNVDFNTRSSVFGYGAYYADGFLGGDDYRYLSGYLWVRPTGNLAFNLWSERLENYGSSKQTIAEGAWDITPRDGIVMRAIWLDGDTLERIAYRRTVRSGTDIFAVYDNSPGTDAQYSVKVLWTFTK